MARQRETAQRERAEARESRRGGPDESQDNGTATEEQPLDGIKQAAKVAAASIALGAVAAGARALVERRHAFDEDDGPRDSEATEREPEQTAELEDVASQGAPQQDEPEQQDEAEQPEEPHEQEAAPQEQQREEQPPPRLHHARPEPRHHEPVAGASPDEARSVADAAQEQLQLLVGKEPEMISALERNDDGWLVTLEVLEVSRVPESTDVLASYEVELDEDRNLRRYARVRRYYRSQSDQDGRS